MPDSIRLDLPEWVIPGFRARFGEALDAEPIGDRAIGLFANASALSPEELDGRDEIDATAPATFATELITTGKEHGLSILGGCCGTDDAHLRAVATLLRR